MTVPARAAWLHMCPPGDGAAGPTPVLADTPGPAGCVSVSLGVGAALVEAVYALPATPEASHTILLQGTGQQGRFIPTSHTIPPGRPAPEPPAPMPMHANLLARMQVRSFGLEERVRASLVDDRLELDCAAGDKPAGVLLSGPWYLPRADVALQLEYAGRGSFVAEVADALRGRQETALPMASFTATVAQQSAALPLPAGLDRGTWRHFVINCPAQAARLSISGARLLPVPAPAARRSSWVWQPQEWRSNPDALLSWAHNQSLNTLFVTVPLDGAHVSDTALLASFVRRAHGEGIAVWAVDGDPHMVLPAEQASAMGRAKAYASYNHAADVAARLDGIQFDIEPYLLPGYDASSEMWDDRYLDLARALRAATAPIPLEFVVPYWWSSRPRLLQALARCVDGLAVMDYRTDPAEIYRFAAPFLDWAAANGKRVRIALEAGPVAPETQRRYARAAGGKGDLLLFQLAGQQVAVLLRQPAAHPQAQAFRQVSTRRFDGTATSFMHDKARMHQLLPALERDFGAWPGFAGMALHGLR